MSYCSAFQSRLTEILRMLDTPHAHTESFLQQREDTGSRVLNFSSNSLITCKLLCALSTQPGHLSIDRCNQKACNCESIATQRPPDLAPVALAYYQHFLGFFVRKYCFPMFWKFRLATTSHTRGATPTSHAHLSTLNKQENLHRFRSESALPVTYAVTLTFDPLTLKQRIGCHVLKLCAKSERN